MRKVLAIPSGRFHRDVFGRFCREVFGRFAVKPRGVLPIL